MNYEREEEQLRQELLDALYAGAAAGMPAMLAEAGDVEDADGDELMELAKGYGTQKKYRGMMAWRFYLFLLFLLLSRLFFIL